jgi:hypothetical protein
VFVGGRGGRMPLPLQEEEEEDSRRRRPREEENKLRFTRTTKKLCCVLFTPLVRSLTNTIT